jgi:hypothetical protein
LEISCSNDESVDISDNDVREVNGTEKNEIL